MNPSKKPSFAPSEKRTRGFALLITITLLAFLVLLLVSLASLTRVETQVASNTQTMAQARQNALMALNIAIGQLQKHTGPDQRVTARADIVTPPNFNWATVPANPTATHYFNARATDTTGIDSFWNASRNRNWTGAWRNTNNSTFDPNQPSAYNATPGTAAWLVSGNENAATFLPTTALTNLSITSAPIDPITDSNGTEHRILVGARTTGATQPAHLKHFVTAPLVPITSTSVPGATGPATVGHYAWWVGDEGIKARVNLIDPLADDTTADAITKRRQSAGRPAVEAMTANGTDGLASSYPINDARLQKIFSSDQLTYLNANATFTSELKSRYHDLSIFSRGVLADVKNGGLKRDFSHILGQSNLGTFRNALNTVPSGHPAYNAAPSSRPHSPAISADTTIYASAFPTNGVSNYPYSAIFDHSATWEQLWSYYNMGRSAPVGVNDGAGAATPRVATGTNQGIHPILIQGKLFYRLRIDADTGIVTTEIMPLLVLANPYSVDLGAANYTVVFSNVSPRLRFGEWADSSVEPNPSNFSDAPESAQLTTSNLRFTVVSTGIPAGEAKIFTLDNDVTIPPGTAAQQATSIIMVNDLDTTTSVRFSTGVRIPADKTHAALYTGGMSLNADIYIGNVAVANRIGATSGRRPSTDSTIENPGQGFVVNPVSSGVQQGGGVMFIVIDGTNPGQQQANFYQLNYRASWNLPIGSNGDNQHPVEWARAFMKNGMTGSNDETPNPFFECHIMRPAGSTSTTHWGLANRGTGIYQNVKPPSLIGDTGRINKLYDLPTASRLPTSLAHLTHFNLIGHHTGQTTLNNLLNSIKTNAWQVNYPIGNSYPTPRVERDQVFMSSSHLGYHFDGSYLWNEILWDRYFFSSFPTSGSFDFENEVLINSRYRPFRDRSTVAWDNPANFRGTYLPSENLLVEGAFNINSTSVEAWKAVLSSLKNIPFGSEPAGTSAVNPALSAPFSRILSPTGGSATAKTVNTEDSWTGFRNLVLSATPNQNEIQQVAEELVMQVRKRGPFLSLADFVNRRLPLTPHRSNPHTLFPLAADPQNLGLRGALQAAIDSVTNQAADVPAPYNTQSGATTNRPSGVGGTGPILAEVAYRMPSVTSGSPGYLLQSDVLSAIGPSLAARSDTFTIRAYGDAYNPVTSTVQGRAWCEAVVQRLPDYVVTSGANANAADELPTANTPNAAFGRRYHVISFRWLSPEDI